MPLRRFLVAAPSIESRENRVVKRSRRRPVSWRGISKLLTVTAPLLLAACANNAPNSPALDEQADSNRDPLEGFNRPMFAIDMKLYHWVLRPVAIAYRDNIPNPIQRGIGNVLRNMNTPLIAADDLLALKPDRFGQSMARFLINTILGVGGIVDVAANTFPYHQSDFGQTLGAWGFGPGPYLVLPIFGPSDPRDALGFGVETIADPAAFEFRMAGANYVNYTRDTLGLVNEYSSKVDDIDELERSSIDYYAAARSLYQQSRAAAVSDARADVTPSAPKPPAPVPTQPSPSAAGSESSGASGAGRSGNAQ